MNKEQAMDLIKESGSPSGAIRHIALLNAFAQVIRPGDKLRILEAGCGEGGLTMDLARRYPDCTFVGIDVSDKQIAKAQARLSRHQLKNVSFIKQDILDCTDKEKFDLIYIIDVLYFIQDDRCFINKIASMHNNNGYLLVHTPVSGQRHFLPFLKLVEKGQVREGYNPAEMSALLGNNYSISESFFTFGLYGKLASELYRLSRNLLFLPFFLLQWLLIPVSYHIAYYDTVRENKIGNSLFTIARKK